MVWRITDPQGDEASKIRFEVLPYCRAGLDLGCGPSKVWPHLIGVDSQVDTQLFGIEMKPDLVVPTCERMPLFASGSMECVFSSHLLEHIVDWRAALAEWWRLVAVGGHLVLYLPHADFYPNIGEPGANPDHKHDFRPSDIVAGMREIGPDWSLLECQERNGGTEYSFLLVFRREAAGYGQREPFRAPLPERRAAIVRVGGHGDALWASSPAALLKRDGWHVTVYTAHTGGDVLRHDPNIDRLIVLPNNAMTDEDLIAYWAHEAAKYGRFHNLIGSVEKRLLFHDSDEGFWWSHKLRHQLANVNYLEMVHTFCEVPQGEYRQRYYPTDAELRLAAKLRGMVDGPVVVIAPCGSGAVKYWPHSQRLMELLAAERIYSVVLGDVRDDKLVGVEPWGSVVAMDWPVRVALAYATLADAVVGTESLIVNAVAMEAMPKVVTLSHSSNENLTKHWENTIALEPVAVGCHPCHRIHGNFNFCKRDTRTGAAACQAAVSAEQVLDLLLPQLRHLQPARQEAVA